MQSVNSINTNQIYLNKLAKPQGQVSFKGGTPDLATLRDKQDEFRRMSENSDDNGILGKISKFATKALGVAIAFTATKICLGKAADMITGALGKGTDKIVEQVGKKSAENAGKVTNLVDRVKKLNIDKIVVNTLAGGAALGVAMKDFGLVKKPVSEQTEDLVDNAIDKASADSYNDDSPTSGSYDEPEFDTHDDDDV